MLILAAAALAGMPLLAVAVVGLAVWHPIGFLLAAAGWGIVARLQRPRDGDPADREAAFLHGVAAELRAGASLRWAIGGGAGRVGDGELDRAAVIARLGRPMAEVAPVLAGSLPVNGRAVSVAVELIDDAGAPAAGLFDMLARRAAAAAADRRERRSASAQARFSAGVVTVAPFAFFGILLLTGRMSDVMASGMAGAVAVGVGAVMQIAGVAVVAIELRRAEALR